MLAENAGHVKAVSEMTGQDLDPYLGRAFVGDGIGTALASLVGGSPTTTYAENIGVMAATRVYSTLGVLHRRRGGDLVRFLPEVRRGRGRYARRRARRNHTRAVRDDRSARCQDLDREPGRLRQPGEPRPGAAGIIAGVGGLAVQFTKNFSITGIAAGTIIVSWAPTSCGGWPRLTCASRHRTTGAATRRGDDLDR